MEGVNLRDPRMGEDAALIAPVHLGLRAGHDLEPAVQPCQLTGRIAQFRRDPGAGFLQVHLDPLIVAGKPVLPGQPLMDHRAPQQQLGAQPRVDHRGIRGDHLLAPVRPRRWLRRSHRAVSLQVLLDRPPVQPGLPGNLRDAHLSPPQRPEPAQLKPPLRLQHHQQPPVMITRSRPQASSCHAALPANTPQPLHVCPYLALHISSYADTWPGRLPRWTGSPAPGRKPARTCGT